MTRNQTINKYLEEHCITEEIIKNYDLRIGINNESIAIPIKDKEGKILFFKTRMFVGEDKYLYEKGSTMQLFNANKITETVKFVIIVEGEFDAMVLQDYMDNNDMYKNRYAIVSSTGGAGSWKDEWTGLLDGKYVAILLDSDKPGVKGAIKLFDKINRNDLTVRLLFMKNGYKDICEMMFASWSGMLHALFHNLGNVFDRPDRMNLFAMSDQKISATKRMKLVKDAFQYLDEMEGGLPWASQSMYIKEMRDHLKKIFDKERPRTTKTKKELSDRDITLAEIRKIPITNFIRFNNQGVASCVFHSERNPSMHYNPPNKTKFGNTVKCFSCGRFGSVVDVVMQINNCSFTDAVEILKKHL